MASELAAPETVRLSLAAAMALGMRSGRSYRDARTGCVNLLLDYPTSCRANCAYCGLARGRDPEVAGEESFIRVEWPTAATEVVVDRIAVRPEVTRVCISMVENRRALGDAVALCRRVRVRSEVPISVLVHPRAMSDRALGLLRDAGADMIGVGLDAATPVVFARHRPGLDWHTYRTTISTARSVFGPWKVNAHLVVGLGETDRDLIALLDAFRSEQVSSYLFCFNPEPGTRLASRRRPTLVRWRRVQLAFHLLADELIDTDAVVYDSEGMIRSFGCDPALVESAVESGQAFRTHGCPDAFGVATCNRPFGSYRPGESFRDYPFSPGAEDIRLIRRQLRLGSGLDEASRVS